MAVPNSVGGGLWQLVLSAVVRVPAAPFSAILSAISASQTANGTVHNALDWEIPIIVYGSVSIVLGFYFVVCGIVLCAVTMTRRFRLLFLFVYGVGSLFFFTGTWPLLLPTFLVLVMVIICKVLKRPMSFRFYEAFAVSCFFPCICSCATCYYVYLRARQKKLASRSGFKPGGPFAELGCVMEEDSLPPSPLVLEEGGGIDSAKQISSPKKKKKRRARCVEPQETTRILDVVEPPTVVPGSSIQAVYQEPAQ